MHVNFPYDSLRMKATKPLLITHLGWSSFSLQGTSITPYIAILPSSGRQGNLLREIAQMGHYGERMFQASIEPDESMWCRQILGRPGSECVWTNLMRLMNRVLEEDGVTLTAFSPAYLRGTSAGPLFFATFRLALGSRAAYILGIIPLE